MRADAIYFNLVVIAALLVVAAQIVWAASFSTNYALISFRDGPDRTDKTPIFVLGPEGTLYPVPDENTALYFWGPKWRENINWWGDKQGAPLPSHVTDYMMPKGQPISTNASWLQPYVASALAKRKQKNKIHVETNEEEKWERFEIDGHQVQSWEGNVDEGTILESTADMTDEERNRFRLRADKQAKMIYSIKKDRKALDARKEKELDATYNTALKAIANLEARLGRKTHLSAYRFKPGNVYLINKMADFVPVPVINGVIDEDDYKNARRVARIKEQMNQYE